MLLVEEKYLDKRSNADVKRPPEKNIVVKTGIAKYGWKLMHPLKYSFVFKHKISK